MLAVERRILGCGTFHFLLDVFAQTHLC